MKIDEIMSNDINECAELYVTVFSSEPWNEPINQIMAMQRLLFLLSTPNAISKKYIIENKIIGYWIGYIEPLSDFNVLFIKEVLVHPSMQGKGIGKKLMDSAEKYALEKKCKTISLHTGRNTNAYFFYGKIGYKLTDELVCMEKILDKQLVFGDGSKKSILVNT